MSSLTGVVESTVVHGSVGSGFVVDASVWVSRFLIADANHAASLHWLRRHVLAGSPLLGPTLLIAELAGAIARRTGDVAFTHQVTSSLMRIPSLSLVALDLALASDAGALATAMRLRGPDAVYTAVALRYSLPLVTCDKEQLTRSAGAVSVYVPATAP
jgi:predicted nucleic acid-binding protein